MNQDKKIEINFSEYFTATLPRYKNFSELKRNEAFYLSNAHFAVGNYINNPKYNHIPEDAIRSISVVDLQQYDSMIDIDGNEYDWSDGVDPYTPEERTVDNKFGDWFEKRLVDVNHVIFDDVLDIHASIIYNLIEIRAKANISIDYLRQYLWFDREQTSDGTVFLVRTREEFCNQLEKSTGNWRYVFSCPALEKQTLLIDDFSEHDLIIQRHNEYLDEVARAQGKAAIQTLFGSPLYENLIKLEARVLKSLTSDELKSERNSFTGFVRMLEEAQLIFMNTKESGIQTISKASVFQFKSACEIILRAKLKCFLRNEVTSNATFSNSIKLLKDNANIMFKTKLPSTEFHNFFNDLHTIRLEKNEASHTTEHMNISEAEKLIHFICNTVIKNIDTYIK